MKALLSLSLFFVLISSAFADNHMADCRPKSMDEHKENLAKMLESSSYSADVKEKLKAIHSKYLNKRSAYIQDIRDLRKSIGEKLFDSKVSAQEIKKMKKEFKKLEEKRIEAGFKSLDEALKILKPVKNTNEKDVEVHKNLFHIFNHSDY